MNKIFLIYCFPKANNIPTEHTEEGLKRVVGVQGLTFTIVNFTIGAGIFALPAIVGVELGAFSLFSYIFCSIMLAAIMFCYAEVGSRITSSGGSYAYVEAAFGKFPGFIINWLFFFGWGVLSDAAVINIVADSLAVLYPVFAKAWMRGCLFFVLISFMIAINIRGAKQGIGFVKTVTIIKLLPLFAIIIFGFGFIDNKNLHWEHLPALKTFGNTTLILFYAFAGFESALGASGEIKTPNRTIPIGIFLGGAIVLIIYLLLQIVTQGVLGADMALVKDAPLAAVAGKMIGAAGTTILLITAAISCFGAVGGDVLASPRLLFAGAKDGLFPRFLARIHPKFATPYMAIITYAALIFLFAVTGGFQQLAIMASTSILLIYLSVILASIKLRKTKQHNTEKTFRMPGGLIIPGIGIAAIVWLLSSLTWKEFFSTLIFISIVSIIYLVMKKIPNEGVSETPANKIMR